MFRLAFFYFATGLARGLPLPLLYWVGDRIAEFAYLIDRPRVRAFQENLRHIAGTADNPRATRALGRQGYRHMATYMAEFFATPRYAPHFLASRVHVTGREHLDEALRQGRGVIIAAGHYSNWELTASMIAYLGYPIHVVANQHPDLRVRALFQQPREHNGVRTLDVYHAARPTYRLLRDNGIVAIMADRDLTGEGVTIEFFGKPVRFPRGPARFSLGTGAPVVFAFIRRRSDRSYDLEIFPPIYPPEGGDRETNVQTMTQQYAQIVEREVAKDPTQYTVFFPIWTAAPPRYAEAPSA